MTHPLLVLELEQFQTTLDRLGYDYAPSDLAADDLQTLRALKVPPAYLAFAQDMNLGGLELRYGGRWSVSLWPPQELAEMQQQYKRFAKKGIVIGQMSDAPLLLALSEAEDEGEDCPVYRTDGLGSRVKIASSFMQYLQMLRLSLEMLGNFTEQDELAAEEDSYSESSYDPYDGYDEPQSGGGSLSYLLEDYYQELDLIDPDCAPAWSLE